MGAKEWGWGSSIAASGVRQWQFFRLQGEGFVCVVWGKRMTLQWDLTMAQECVSGLEFETGGMVSKMGSESSKMGLQNGVS